MERSGQLYEAIQFYRRAVQLVPDIEFKLDTKTKSKAKEYQESEENFKGKWKTVSYMHYSTIKLIAT